MAEYEGFIASKKRDGLIEVVIRPTSEGIPGASENINRQVCHCAADGSQVRVDALDQAGAEVGDWVLVRKDTSALLRNALVLVGIPLVGLIAAFIAAYLGTGGFATPNLTSISIAVAIALAAVITSLLSFRRTYQRAVPVIVRILRRAAEMPSQGSEICAQQEKSSACSACYFSC